MESTSQGIEDDNVLQTAKHQHLHQSGHSVSQIMEVLSVHNHEKSGLSQDTVLRAPQVERGDTTENHEEQTSRPQIVSDVSINPVQLPEEQTTLDDELLKSPLEMLEEDGYVVLPGALPIDQVEELKAELKRELYEKIDSETTPAGDPASCFAKINSRHHRHDMRLRLEGNVSKAVKTVINGCYAAIYLKLFPPAAQLVELGVITSQGGAQRQTIHSDIDFDADSRRIYTSFMALQDITPEMGPTMIWPGTNSQYFCEFYKPRMNGPVDQYYSRNTPATMVVKAGDVVLMDTRVMHCGGENQSRSDRMLMHFSFESTEEPNPPRFASDVDVVHYRTCETHYSYTVVQSQVTHALI
eukprot:m.76395 g.76395  ORF g.76395 m.76395 type:complete len:355 (+) comp24891_c1_seq6:199-1263(+)